MQIITIGPFLGFDSDGDNRIRQIYSEYLKMLDSGFRLIND